MNLAATCHDPSEHPSLVSFDERIENVEMPKSVLDPLRE